ncbi:DUF5698 domain-containing protein [Candidatus Gracilibacteria bacterium]|nr:DUF5698 domain-containing protein [Candidatus Gracilibacteria bacterium]MCF7819142.1 DUF5698 domain-containing protein [Candidatus Gracilibacteria bacterium]
MEEQVVILGAEWMNDPWFVWGVIPGLLFLSQVAIVTFSTLRIIFISRGKKLLSSCLGFFEVLIWLLAVSQIVQNLDNPLYYLVYGLGFAIGNSVGIWIEDKLAVGTLMIRLITKTPATKLTRILKKYKYRFTSVPAIGASGKRVNVLYIILKRKNTGFVVKHIRQLHAKSFFTIEDIRYVNEGMMPLVEQSHIRRWNFLSREK